MPTMTPDETGHESFKARNETKWKIGAFGTPHVDRPHTLIEFAWEYAMRHGRRRAKKDKV